LTHHFASTKPQSFFGLGNCPCSDGKSSPGLSKPATSASLNPPPHIFCYVFPKAKALHCHVSPAPPPPPAYPPRPVVPKALHDQHFVRHPPPLTCGQLTTRPFHRTQVCFCSALPYVPPPKLYGGLSWAFPKTSFRPCPFLVIPPLRPSTASRLFLEPMAFPSEAFWTAALALFRFAPHHHPRALFTLSPHFFLTKAYGPLPALTLVLRGFFHRFPHARNFPRRDKPAPSVRYGNHTEYISPNTLFFFLTHFHGMSEGLIMIVGRWLVFSRFSQDGKYKVFFVWLCRRFPKQQSLARFLAGPSGGCSFLVLF